MSILDYKLQVFVACATHLSFSKAGRSLHISQPAVSRHIRQLEAHYGVSLFERKGSHIQLTTAGTCFLEHARGLIRSFERLDFEMSMQRNALSGRLKLGASTTLSQYVLPEILADFHQKFPALELSLQNGNTEEIEAAVREKRLNLGFTEGLHQQSPLQYHRCLEDELVVVVGASHPFAHRTKISLQELQACPLVLREAGSGTLECLTAYVKKHGLYWSDFTIAMRLGSSESIKRYIQDQKTAAFLSIHTLREAAAHKSYRLLRLEEGVIARDFFYMHRAGVLSEAEALFMRFFKQEVCDSL